MSKKLFAIWLFAICIVFASSGCIFNGGDGNKPPEAPSITCPTEAEIDEEVVITARSTDPDRDRISYKVRFGDGVDSEWSEYFPSGQEVTFTHKYKEIGDYPIKAIASDRKAIGGWSESKWIKISQPPPQRRMSILWCGDEKWAEVMGGLSFPIMKTLHRDVAETWVGYGGTHIVGFHEPCRPDWYVGFNVKLISYLKYYSIDEIRAYVRKWKDHPNNGGYWMIEGHEPDITGGDMNNPETVKAHKELRIAQYRAIREEDPDAWGHPVVIWYNCTGAFAHYPGWQNAFPTPEEGVDCDIYAADIYANRCDGTTNYEGLESAANNLVTIGMERSNGQFIPCLGAFVKPGCQAVTPLEQWEWWVEWYYNQTGEELRAVAYYFSGLGSTAAGVYENEVLQEGAREINRRLGLLK